MIYDPKWVIIFYVYVVNYIILLHKLSVLSQTECLKDLSPIILTQLVPHSSLRAEEDGMAYFLYKSHFKAFIIMLRFTKYSKSKCISLFHCFLQGLMRQLVLLPGSDATSQICPSSEPQLSALSVPQALLHLPIKPSSTDLPLHPYGETTENINTGIIGCMSVCTVITKSTPLAHMWSM